MISASTKLEPTTVPGITSAIAALSIGNINLNGKPNNNVLLTCNIDSIESKLSRYASVVHMSRLRFHQLSDNLICSSVISKDNVIINHSIGLLAQNLFRVSLRDVVFTTSSWKFNSPTLVTIGEAINKHYWIS